MDSSLSDSLNRVEALIARAGGPAAETGLGSASIETLRRVVEDRSAPLADRRAALRGLEAHLRGERAFSDLILALIDDPDEDLAREAIASAPPFDGRVVERLRMLMDDPRPAIWEAAASALSRKKDRAILPRMLAWARSGDAEHRRVGLVAVGFLLIPEEHLAVIESICEEGPRDEADELLLIDALRVAEGRVAFWRKAVGEAEE